MEWAVDADCRTYALPGVRKTHPLRHFHRLLKTIVLTRKAWDKHRESAPKRDLCVFRRQWLGDPLAIMSQEVHDFVFVQR
jgi:hypothetical protein